MQLSACAGCRAGTDFHVGFHVLDAVMADGTDLHVVFDVLHAAIALIWMVV